MYTIKANVIRLSEDGMRTKEHHLGTLSFVTHDTAAFVEMRDNMHNTPLPDGCTANVDTYVSVRGNRYDADPHTLLGVADHLASVAREIREAGRKARVKPAIAAE